MKLFITGSNGQLGWELLNQGSRWDFEIVGASHRELDITNPMQIADVVSPVQPDLIINAAAYTQVDQAETEQTLAYAVNRDGPAHLADFCAASRIPLIHISTDYVFDGTTTSPYLETAPVAPLGVYGKSKEAGETEVRSRLDQHIIIRTSWLYGIHGHNFVKTIIRLGKERDTLRVVADQFGSPTGAEDLAKALLIIAESIRSEKPVDWGTYHYCGLGITTWHGFAETILEETRRYISIQTQYVKAITTAEYPTIAKRPAFSALDCTRMENHFGIQRIPWQESLKTMIHRLFSSS